MPPVFPYVCKSCGVSVESDRVLTDETRHIDDKGKVCGTLRRDWKAQSTAINIEAIRAVPRGR